MKLRATHERRLPGGRRVWFLGGISAAAFGLLLLGAHFFGRLTGHDLLGMDLGARHVMWNAIIWMGCGGVALLSWVATPPDGPPGARPGRSGPGPDARRPPADGPEVVS